MPHKISLTQFMLEQQRRQPDASGNFTLLLNNIVMACKQIAQQVNRGNLIDVLGNAGSENIQGEVQKKLDVITHDLMVGALNWTGLLAGMASEETEDIIAIPTDQPKGNYLVLFDPLDGSSNIDLNLSVGTIFSILRCDAEASPTIEDFLQKGSEQVCAGFVIYGPATMLVLTTGQGVNGFTLDQVIGEFFLTHPSLKIPEETQEFAINMSNYRHWEAPIRRYVDECLQGKTGVRQKDFNMRWIASMVAEVYRILMRGGVFMYPYDVRDPSKPGRLRLLYEANPMAFIIEQAGGACSTGVMRMLDVTPASLHQRVPVILGAKLEVERLVQYHQAS